MQQLAEAMQLACDAALAGDLDLVKARLREAEHLDGYSINAKGTRSRTPLYQSCLGRNPEVALWLLDHGAQDEPEGCGYVAICATGKGTEESADPGERTAAIMRRFGFAGKPRKAKKKKKEQTAPQTDKTRKCKQKGKNKGGPKNSQSAKKLLELAVAAAAAGDTAPLLTRGGSGKNAELPIHHAARTKNVEALAVLLATDCAKEQLLSATLPACRAVPASLCVRARARSSPLCRANTARCCWLLCSAVRGSGAGKGGKLPVHYAVETKDVSSLQLMITVGGAEQLLQPDSDGRIPLQCALSGSSTEVPLALLAVRLYPCWCSSVGRSLTAVSACSHRRVQRSSALSPERMESYPFITPLLWETSSCSLPF